MTAGGSPRLAWPSAGRGTARAPRRRLAGDRERRRSRCRDGRREPRRSPRQDLPPSARSTAVPGSRAEGPRRVWAFLPGEDGWASGFLSLPGAPARVAAGAPLDVDAGPDGRRRLLPSIRTRWGSLWLLGHREHSDDSDAPGG